MKNRKLLLVLIVVLLFGCQSANGLTGAVSSPAVSQGPTAPPAATVTGWSVALNTKAPTPPPTATLPLPTYHNLALSMFSDGGGWLLTAFSNNETGLLHTTDGGLSWSNVLPTEFSDIAVKVYFLIRNTPGYSGRDFFNARRMEAKPGSRSIRKALVLRTRRIFQSCSFRMPIMDGRSMKKSERVMLMFL